MSESTGQRVFSSAFNFHEFIHHGVDPRTGSYSCELHLADVKTFEGRGPLIPIKLRFSSMDPADVGFGVGWSMSVSSFNTQTHRLTLASGEVHELTKVADQYAFKDHKVNNLLFLNDGAGRFRVVTKTGNVEELTVHGDSHLAVTSKVTSSNGLSCTFAHRLYQGKLLLHAIFGRRESLRIDYLGEGGFVLTQNPGTRAEAVFSVRKVAEETVVSLPENAGEWRIGYTVLDGRTYIQRVINPMRGEEHLEYGNVQLHSRSSSGHKEKIHAVSKYTRSPGFGNPAIVKTYEFSAKNFLLRGEREGDAEGEAVYEREPNYQYSSVERQMNGDLGKEREVRRTYNVFHLLICEEVACGNTRHKCEYEHYPAKKGLPSQQSANYQLVHVKTVTYEEVGRTEGPKQRVEKTTTEFDEYGNLLSETKPDGTRSEYLYYTVDELRGSIPIVRHLKELRRIPAPAPTPNGTLIKRFSYTVQSSLTAGGYLDVWPETEELIELSTGLEKKCFQQKTTYLKDIKKHRVYGRPAYVDISFGSEEFTQLSYAYRFFEQEFGNGKVEVETTVAGFDGTSKITTHVYSAYTGEELSRTADGAATVVAERDVLGRLVRETVSPYSKYEAGRKTEYLQVSRSAEEDKEQAPCGLRCHDVNGRKQIVFYDGFGRVLSVSESYEEIIDEHGMPLTAEVYGASYNDVGQLAYESFNDYFGRPDKTAPIVLTKKYDYDDWGHLKAIVHTDRKVERISFDPISMSESRWLLAKSASGGGGDKVFLALTESMREAKNVSIKKINLFGHVDEVKVFDGQSWHTTSNTYDGIGRCVSRKDPLGNVSHYRYDVFDRKTQTILPDGTVVETRYAANSHEPHPTEIKVGSVILGTQEFDGIGRLIKKATGGVETQYQYARGVPYPELQTNADGSTIRYSHDAHLDGALLLRHATVVVNEKPESVLSQRWYDPRTNKLVTAQEGDSSVNRSYWPSGYIKEESYRVLDKNYSVRHSYSHGGRLVKTILPNGDVREVVYDEAGRVEKVSQSAIQAQMTYDPVGLLSEVEVLDTPQGYCMKTSLEYDALGRETRRTLSFKKIPDEFSTVHWEMQSEYAADNNLVARSIESAGQETLSESFVYDSRGRLVRYRCEGESPLDGFGRRVREQVYEFDVFDNITSVKTEAADGAMHTEFYDYDIPAGCGRLTGVRVGGETVPSMVFKYDKSGRLVTDGQKEHTYRYDALGRLNIINNVPRNVVEAFSYDGTDRLLTVAIGGLTRNRFYIDSRVCVELINETAITFLEHAGMLLAQCEGTKVGENRPPALLFGTDMNNSVRVVATDDPRDPVRTLGYLPYGLSGSEAGKRGIHRTHDEISLAQFNGELRSAVMGGYHLGNGYRTYDPELMRFHQPDASSPFGAGGINAYAYCLGDPINHIDPTGHWSWRTWLGIGLGVLTIVAVVAEVMTAGAITPLLVVGASMGVCSGVTGIASALVKEYHPGSVAGDVLGYVSMVTGLLSLSVGAYSNYPQIMLTLSNLLKGAASEAPLLSRLASAVASGVKTLGPIRGTLLTGTAVAKGDDIRRWAFRISPA